MKSAFFNAHLHAPCLPDCSPTAGRVSPAALPAWGLVVVKGCAFQMNTEAMPGVCQSAPLSHRLWAEPHRGSHMRPSSLNTLRLSHLSAASRPRCCVEAPEGNSAPRMCPGWHRSGAEPPLTACFALPPSRPGPASLRGQHPAAVASLRAPGWSFVRHNCNFNSQRGGLRAASGNSALPWDGPSWRLRGPDWGMGKLSPPG